MRPPQPDLPQFRKKIWKNWKRRIQYAQRHPITVREVRQLREHMPVLDTIAEMK